MKKGLKVILIIILFLLLFIVPFKSYSLDSLETNEERIIDYTETLDSFKNPERGFYTPIGYNLKRKDNEVLDYGYNLIHLRVGLKDFTKANNNEDDFELTEDALNALDATLKNIKKNGGSVIIRFAYDNFYGIANVEPSMDMILTHIRQLKEVFYNNKDVITYVELGFFGPYGEMHSSSISTTDNVSLAIDTMLESLPEDITIGVRTPNYYAKWALVSRTELDKNITQENTKYYRVGLFNDGYLGSESDLGTFANREIELKWLNNQAKHTLYGGEVVKSYATNDLLNTIDYISKEGFITHTTYLNSLWNDTVINEWKNTIYDGDDELYKGQTGYKYIDNHLGYRYVLRSSNIAKEIKQNEKLNINFSIENVGFGNLVNKKIVSIVLKNNEKCYEIKTNLDAREWNSKEISDINIDLELPNDIEVGNYDVYLRLSCYGNLETDNNYKTIRIANNDIWNDEIGANYLGKVKVGIYVKDEKPTIIDIPIENKPDDKSIIETSVVDESISKVDGTSLSNLVNSSTIKQDAIVVNKDQKKEENKESKDDVHTPIKIDNNEESKKDYIYEINGVKEKESHKDNLIFKVLIILVIILVVLVFDSIVIKKEF